jgi:hypothetical protein
MLNPSCFLIATATLIAAAAGSAEFAGANAIASRYKQCGHVDGTVAVSVKGNVSCKTARAVAKAYDKGHNNTFGFHCKTHASNAGSGHYGVCKKGTEKRIVVTPE